MATDIPPRQVEHIDELVVDLDHVEVVLDELRRLVDRGILATPPAAPEGDLRNDTLGLGVITLDFTPDPVAQESGVVGSAGDVSVTEVLQMIRDAASYRYRGWMPTVGKNRVLTGIGGEGGYLGGGGGYLGGGGGYLGGGGGYLGGGSGTSPEVAKDPGAPTGDAGAGQTVAVLDTPLIEDMDFGDHVEYDGDWFVGEGVVPAAAGHAAFVVGLIRRAAAGATIQVRPMLNERARATAWSVASKMVGVAESNTVSVLNLSLGCYTLDNEPPLLLQRAVDRLSSRILVVAAAGNHLQPDYPRPFWPAALSGVVAVGATRDKDHLASFSPRSPWVDVLAPGVDLVSDYLVGEVEVEPGKEPVSFNGFASWSGTSFASAKVVGEIAASRQSDEHPRQTLLRIIRDGNASGVSGYRYSTPTYP